MGKMSKKAIAASEIGGLDYLQKELSKQLKNLKKSRFNRNTFEPLAILLISYLKKKYRTELITKGHVHPDNISIVFKQGVVYTACDQGTGLIQIGCDILIAPKKIGYQREEKWQLKWCRTGLDYAIWLILHEFAHLFKRKGKTDNHDFEFFSLIDRLAIENSFIFNR